MKHSLILNEDKSQTEAITQNERLIKEILREFFEYCGKVPLSMKIKSSCLKTCNNKSYYYAFYGIAL